MGNNKIINTEAYELDYKPYIIKWGMLTNLIGIVLSYLPCLVLLFIFDIKVPVGAVFVGFLMQVSVSGVFWFVEPISYFPVLGIPGTYMAFLSGNIGNLRLPAAVAAQEASGVKLGTEEGAVISTIGVGVSVFVNIVILAIGVFLGASILGALPANLLATLNNILPALFGAMLGQQFIPNPKIGIVAVILAGGMIGLSKLGLLAFLPFGGTYMIIIVAVFGSILIGRRLNKDLLSSD